MLQVILLIELALGIFCLFTRKKGKLISALIIIFMFFNFMAAQSTMDSFAYSRAYLHICEGASFSSLQSLNYGIDIGFYYVAKVISLFTHDYMLFRGVIFIIAMTFILKSMQMLDNRTLIPITMMVLFPFQYDTFQIEYFLAYALVTYGISILISDKKRSTLKFILLVLLASLIHLYVLPFLVILLFRIDAGILRKVITGLILTMTVLNLALRVNYVYILYRIVPGLDRLLPSGGYLSGDSLNILTIIMSLALIITIYYYSYYIKRIYVEDKSISILFKINSVLLVFMPFIFTTLNFERYFRPYLVLNYVLINKTAVLGNKKARYIEALIVAMLIFRFWVHWNYYVSNNNDIVKYILKAQE